MDRKERIDKFVSQMEEKYKPSVMMKNALRMQLAGLLDPNISESTFYSLLNLAEKTYQRSSEIKESCAVARKSLAELSSDLTNTTERLKKAVEEYGRTTTTVLQTYASMADTLNSAGRIIAVQEQTIKQLAEDKGKLEDKVLEAHLKQNPPKAKA